MKLQRLPSNAAYVAVDSFAALRRIGYRTGLDPRIDVAPENVRLVLDCPFCRKPIFHRGLLPYENAALGECPRCDVVFDFEPEEVYACLLRVRGFRA